MDQQQTIASVEARAKAAGLPIAELCRRAGVHPTTFSRWKLSEKNPEPVGITFSTLAKIEAVLAASNPADQAHAA